MTISRRGFITVSAATSIAGFLKRPVVTAYAKAATSHDLTLAITGSQQQGYGTALQFRGEPIAHHNAAGEFSAFFQNSDRSLEDRIENWRAASYTGTADHLVLQGKVKLPNLNVAIFAEVEYRVAAPRVVRKQIRLHQVDLDQLFFQVSNCLEPLEAPASFWSFDQANCKGGALREYFPAAGFRTAKGVTLGLLTDSGYRNQWSRIIRRDAKPVKPAPHHIPDVHLYYVCRNADRDRSPHHFFVKQTFGEALVVEEQNSSTRVPLPAVVDWHKAADFHAQEHDGTINVSINGPDAKAIIPFPAKD